MNEYIQCNHCNRLFKVAVLYHPKLKEHKLLDACQCGNTYKLKGTINSNNGYVELKIIMAE